MPDVLQWLAPLADRHCDRTIKLSNLNNRLPQQTLAGTRCTCEYARRPAKSQQQTCMRTGSRWLSASKSLWDQSTVDAGDTVYVTLKYSLQRQGRSQDVSFVDGQWRLRTSLRASLELWVLVKDEAETTVETSAKVKQSCCAVSGTISWSSSIASAWHTAGDAVHGTQTTTLCCKHLDLIAAYVLNVFPVAERT